MSRLSKSVRRLFEKKRPVQLGIPALVMGPGMMTLRDRGIERPYLNLQEQRRLHADIDDEFFWSIVPMVFDYTEIPIEIIFNFYSAIRYVIGANVPGDIVECGVHMGGSVMAAEYTLLKFDKSTCRRILALDTFTGFISRHEQFDVDLETGALACDPSSSDDYSEASVANMRSTDFDRLEIVKGDVLKTIPSLDTTQISVLRLDTDSYETTKFELEHLYEKVAIGGIIIIDDYGYTVGCKKAVDDFIRDKPIMLQRINRNVRSWIKTAN